MTDKIFIDTNILVYNFNKEEQYKNTVSSELLTNFLLKENYIISSQVVGELCNVLIKKYKPDINLKDIIELIENIAKEKIVSLQKQEYIKALKIKEKYKYSFWDSLIIATAINNDCAILYSEDLQHNQEIENLKIINPYFRTGGTNETNK